MRALWLPMLALVTATGCSVLHQNSLKQRLVQTRFFAKDLAKPLQEVDTFLTSRREDAVKTWCELCVTSAQKAEGPAGGRSYCLSSHGESTCLIATASGPDSTHFAPEPGTLVSSQVIRALWTALDPERAALAEVADAEALMGLAADEEANFTPRFSFIAGGKVGAVISYDQPTFTFGGQVGFRYWSGLFLIPGAVFEIENMIQGARSFAQTHLQARVELALWTDDNTRFFNLPKLSFVMGGGPLVGFGTRPALGGRAVFGIHLDHLAASIVTPIFFEVGFQALEVDEQSSTGLRFALGLGF